MRNRCPICFVFGTRESPRRIRSMVLQVGWEKCFGCFLILSPWLPSSGFGLLPSLVFRMLTNRKSFGRRRRKHGRSEFPLVKLMASRAKVPWIEFIECTERTETIGIIYCIIIIIISNQSNLSKRFFKLHHVLKPKLCTWKHYGRFLEDHDIEADSIQGTSCWPPPSHCHTSDRSGWCHSHVALPHPVPHRTWRCKQSQHAMLFFEAKVFIGNAFFPRPSGSAWKLPTRLANAPSWSSQTNRQKVCLTWPVDLMANSIPVAPDPSEARHFLRVVA